MRIECVCAIADMFILSRSTQVKLLGFHCGISENAVKFENMFNLLVPAICGPRPAAKYEPTFSVSLCSTIALELSTAQAQRPQGPGGLAPPPQFFLMRAQIFLLQISFPKSKLCTVLQYYQCTVHYENCNVKSKLTNTVCANGFTISLSLYVRYTYCTT